MTGLHNLLARPVGPSPVEGGRYNGPKQNNFVQRIQDFGAAIWIPRSPGSLDC